MSCSVTRTPGDVSTPVRSIRILKGQCNYSNSVPQINTQRSMKFYMFLSQHNTTPARQIPPHPPCSSEMKKLFRQSPSSFPPRRPHTSPVVPIFEKSSTQVSPRPLTPRLHTIHPLIPPTALSLRSAMFLAVPPPCCSAPGIPERSRSPRPCRPYSRSLFLPS